MQFIARFLLVSHSASQPYYNLFPALPRLAGFISPCYLQVFTKLSKKELTLMYIIIPTHGHYEIRDGPTFIQSADTYREAWHELASLINSPT